MHHNRRLISWWRPLPVFPPVSSSTGPVWVSRFSLILPQSPSITPWLHHDSLLCCKYTTLKMFLSCRWSCLNEPRMRNWQMENWHSNSECCASLDLTCDSDLHQLWGCLWSPLYHSAQNKTLGQHLLLLCCFSIRILSDLSCARSPEPQTTCIIKAVFKYPVVFQDLQQLCFILAVLFFLFSLVAVPHCCIYILF